MSDHGTSRTGARPHVLVVDDEPSIVDAVGTALRYEGCDVAEAALTTRTEPGCPAGRGR